MAANNSPYDSDPPGEVDGVSYDPASDIYRSTFDSETVADAPVVAVVETVGAVFDRDPTTLPPLFETVQPGALTRLVNTALDRHVSVTFSYEGCEVTVSSSGEVVVDPAG